MDGFLPASCVTRLLSEFYSLISRQQLSCSYASPYGGMRAEGLASWSIVNYAGVIPSLPLDDLRVRELAESANAGLIMPESVSNLKLPP